MNTADNMRKDLIDSILPIINKELLVAIDELVASNSLSSKTTELTHEQTEILKLSAQDIKDGKLISQEAIEKRNLEWLNAM